MEKKKKKEKKIDWEDIAKRALADLDNYKKQQERMRGEMTQFMNVSLLHKFLSVSDDLNRMLNSIDDKEIGSDVAQGIEMILSKIDEIFTSEGLEKIEAKEGDEFDPNIMEAISHEEHKEVKEDHVIEQFEGGLKYNNKIIKPVKVRVSKGVNNE